MLKYKRIIIEGDNYNIIKLLQDSMRKIAEKLQLHHLKPEPEAWKRLEKVKRLNLYPNEGDEIPSALVKPKGGILLTKKRKRKQ
ncbi:hypothetical protein M5K25_021022 [Dendrobium thyrsiflorum]|uniref:30S ribosomal protein S21 n=1 Tax=Dendrobium thyrsiflorum TaxID=117978 RepID=A0ABD0UBC6_DENTH